MSQVDSEIFIRVAHLDGDQKSAVLNYIQNLKGRNHIGKKRRRKAMRQIQEALNGKD